MPQVSGSQQRAVLWAQLSNWGCHHHCKERNGGSLDPDLRWMAKCSLPQVYSCITFIVGWYMYNVCPSCLPHEPPMSSGFHFTLRTLYLHVLLPISILIIDNCLVIYCHNCFLNHVWFIITSWFNQVSFAWDGALLSWSTLLTWDSFPCC